MQLRSNYVHEDLKGPLPVNNDYGVTDLYCGCVLETFVGDV